MTTQDLLKTYKVEMINYLIPSANGNHSYNTKVFLGGGEMESFFGVYCKTVADLNEIIIPTLQHFIDGNNPPMNETDANIEGIDNFLIIQSDGAHFYGLPNFKHLQTVPLDHLKIIAQAWRDFLLQPF